MRYEIRSKEDNIRIDKYLSEKFDFSRNFFKNLIDQKLVVVNGNTVKSSYQVNEGDLIVFRYEEEKITIQPEKMDLDIIYEDEFVAVINKPKNMIVHPTNSLEMNTLVNGLLYRYESLGNMDSIRPGIVHRLDKDTSGLVVIAKTDESYNSLVSQFSEGKVDRLYKALVHGRITNNLIIDKPIGRDEKTRIKFAINYKNGKPAISKVNPIETYEDYSFIEVKLETGRTHQIRVHLSSINHPVVGDLIYGRENEFKIKTQLLHAYYLSFNHPRTMERVHFESAIPKEFEDILGRIRR
ncbi:MAG: RluA family pseudouridine synthase [Tissierellia bacterium]|nr:RluA family pseudouridine synthase [Tissierellia bacterium]